MTSAPLAPFLTFIRLGRPHFLVGGFLLHGLGVAMALYEGAQLKLPALLWGQVAITAIQWMTQYSNEYFDLAVDRANRTPTRWSGGSRVLAEGLLPPVVALVTATILAAVALTAALVLALVLKSGGLALPLLVLALLLAWGYSAPPLRLHSRGLGELTTAVLVTGMTPLVGYYLQANRLALLPFLAVLPLCCLQFAMLLMIEFPDAAGDAAGGKRTLVVRMGGARAASLYLAALLAAYGSLPLLVALGLPLPAAIAIGLGAPVAMWQGRRMLRQAWTDPAAWNGLALGSIGLLIGTIALELLAFLWR
ncbi:MAG: prenyltransferase [Anaerolineae bacterium]